MTDSPRLEEVFAGVLAEHRFRDGDPLCACGVWWSEQHQAERLAARFKLVGYADCGTWRIRNQILHADDVPLFRLVGGDQ